MTPRTIAVMVASLIGAVGGMQFGHTGFVLYAASSYACLAALFKARRIW